MGKEFVVTGIFKNTKSFYVEGKDGRERSNIPGYKTAVEMWKKEINWAYIRDIIASQCKGSQREADQIAKHLTLFKHIASGVGINPLEQTMYKEYLKDPNFQTFLSQLGPGSIATWQSVKATEQGDILENFIDKVVASALEATGARPEHGKTGQYQIASQAVLGTVAITLTGKDKSIFKRVNGEITNLIKDDIRAQIKADLDPHNRIKTALDMTIKGWSHDTYLIEVRMGLPKQQKIDLDFSDVIVRLNDSGILDKFLRLVAGHTFSAKNYGFGDDTTHNVWKSASFRNKDSSSARQYSSFYYAGSMGSANGADAATFCYSTLQSTSLRESDAPNFLAWSEFLYEMLGMGQQSDHRLVDYIVVNNASSPTDAVMVESVKTRLQNLRIKDFYNSDPPFVLNNRGELTVKRFASTGKLAFIK